MLVCVRAFTYLKTKYRDHFQFQSAFAHTLGLATILKRRGGRGDQCPNYNCITPKLQTITLSAKWRSTNFKAKIHFILFHIVLLFSYNNKNQAVLGRFLNLVEAQFTQPFHKSLNLALCSSTLRLSVPLIERFFDLTKWQFGNMTQHQLFAQGRNKQFWMAWQYVKLTKLFCTNEAPSLTRWQHLSQV